MDAKAAAQAVQAMQQAAEEEPPKGFTAYSKYACKKLWYWFTYGTSYDVHSLVGDSRIELPMAY